MGNYTILRNSQLDVELVTDYQDNGWSLSGGNAIHNKCNSGTLFSNSVKTKPGVVYSASFTISGLSGGVLKISIGGDEFEINSNGSYSRDFESIDSSGMLMWSDADVIVSPVIVTEGSEDFVTLLYNPIGILDSYISFTSDYMVKLSKDFYTFKNGSLWKHNSNEVRNSFYGEVHKSIIKFMFNPEPQKIKNLQNVKINGNKSWDLMEVLVFPHEGKPNGQYSRLTKNRFERVQTDYYANFLKDMNDPRFEDRIQALFEGADLQGKVIEVTMEVEGVNELRLVSIDFTYTDSNYTF